MPAGVILQENKKKKKDERIMKITEKNEHVNHVLNSAKN